MFRSGSGWNASGSARKLPYRVPVVNAEGLEAEDRNPARPSQAASPGVLQSDGIELYLTGVEYLRQTPECAECLGLEG